MIMAGLYVFFLTVFTGAGAALGYLAEQRWPGSGSLIAVGVFLAAVWLAWTVSLRISEHFWPEQPTT